MKGKERLFLVVLLVMLMVAGSGCAKKENRYALRYAHKILNWDLSRTREEVEFVSSPEDKEMKISLQENEVDIENLVGVLYTIMDFKSVAALEKISEGCYHFKNRA